MLSIYALLYPDLMRERERKKRERERVERKWGRGNGAWDILEPG
jgi:hypothetical protein